MRLAGEIYDNIDRCFPDAEKVYYNAARITGLEQVNLKYPSISTV